MEKNKLKSGEEATISHHQPWKSMTKDILEMMKDIN
jgi:hypothetical protein